MSDDYQLERGEKGAPILLAVRAPGQVATQPDPSGIVVSRGAASGNPNADPKTGRFAGGGGGKGMTGKTGLFNKLTESAQNYLRAQMKATGADGAHFEAQGSEVKVTLRKGEAALLVVVLPTEDSNDDVKKSVEQSQAATASRIPPGVDPEVWEKRLDMVRDAAREMDDMDLGDAKEWLKGKVADLSSVNVDQFVTDVREHRLDDLADILDHQLRSKVDGMKRARRHVRVTAPRGWTTRVFAGLSDEEVLKLAKRLEGRGWDPADISKHVVSKVTNEERKTKLEQLYGEQQKSGKKAKKNKK